MKSLIANPLYAFLGMAFLLAACSKNKNVKPVTQPAKDTTAKADTSTHDVYIAGYSGDTAVYWKNGKEIHLTDGSSRDCAYSIFVTANNDVYAAGSVHKGNAGDQLDYVPTSWKNGAITYLENDPQAILSEGYSITVSGGNVYVGGYTAKPSNYATLWINGKANYVGTANCTAYSVFANGIDVYLCGQSFVNDTSVATCWKNDMATTLGIGSAQSVFVSNNDVYTAGFKNVSGGSNAAYWKNGALTNLTTDAGYNRAFSVFVSDGDVYAAGYHVSGTGEQTAAYWKNGALVTLNNNRSWAQSIYVIGKNVYVAGVVINPNLSIEVATYWKNGIETKIGPNGSSAYGLFVK